MANDPQPQPAAPAPTPTAASGREGLTTASLAGAAPAPGESRTFAPADAEGGEGKENAAPLFAEGETGELRNRWTDIQAGFVDEPRKAVQEADQLVAGAMQRLAEIFAAERARLEGEWDRGGDVSTEDLRQALRRYRSFFTRLLSV